MRKIILAISTGVVMLTPAAASATMTSAPSLTSQVAQLKVASEHRAGYKRSLFGPFDRPAVLAANFAAFPACDGYFSRYDGKCYETDLNGDGTSSTEEKAKVDDEVDIDHTVALGEAWDSGAWAWTSAQRDALAADARGSGNLQVMTDNLNASKGDDDATGWLPPLASQTCQFVGVVVHVKLTYDLTVDSAEKAKLAGLAAQCDGGPKPKPKPTPTKSGTHSAPSSTPTTEPSTPAGEAPVPTPVPSNLPVTG